MQDENIIVIDYFDLSPAEYLVIATMSKLFDNIFPLLSQCHHFWFEETLPILDQGKSFGWLFKQHQKNLYLSQWTVETSFLFNRVQILSECVYSFWQFKVICAFKLMFCHTNSSQSACEYYLLKIFEIEGNSWTDLLHVLRNG